MRSKIRIVEQLGKQDKKKALKTKYHPGTYYL
jgi:hypothetical protein